LADVTAPGAVLITRPEPAASITAARLLAMGRRPIVAPILGVRMLGAELPDPAWVQAVLVTSANAVAGLSEGLRALPLLAVGAATAQRARERGFTQVRSADGDARALAALAGQWCAIGGLPLLLAHGVGQGDALALGLQARGFAVIRAAVYQTHAVEALPQPAAVAWSLGEVTAALFFSAETARGFVRLVAAAGWQEGARQVEALAIGRPAEAALAPLPWRRVRVADRPDQEAMLALLS
jgi:uroporphyrinogen-III synthase